MTETPAELPDLLAPYREASANSVTWTEDRSLTLTFAGRKLVSYPYSLLTRINWDGGSTIVVWFGTRTAVQLKGRHLRTLFEGLNKHVVSQVRGIAEEENGEAEQDGQAAPVVDSVEVFDGVYDPNQLDANYKQDFPL